VGLGKPPLALKLATYMLLSDAVMAMPDAIALGTEAGMSGAAPEPQWRTELPRHRDSRRVALPPARPAHATPEEADAVHANPDRRHVVRAQSRYFLSLPALTTRLSMTGRLCSSLPAFWSNHPIHHEIRVSALRDRRVSRGRTSCRHRRRCGSRGVVRFLVAPLPRGQLEHVVLGRIVEREVRGIDDERLGVSRAAPQVALLVFGGRIDDSPCRRASCRREGRGA